jgi:hypothetical protein
MFAPDLHRGRPLGSYKSNLLGSEKEKNFLQIFLGLLLFIDLIPIPHRCGIGQNRLGDK